MKKSVFQLSTIILLFVASLLVTTTADAQCPMCRMSAETNLANGGSEGKGLNQGILYLLFTPYIIVGIGGFIWYRNRNRREEDELVAELPER